MKSLLLCSIAWLLVPMAGHGCVATVDIGAYHKVDSSTTLYEPYCVWRHNSCCLAKKQLGGWSSDERACTSDKIILNVTGFHACNEDTCLVAIDTLVFSILAFNVRCTIEMRVHLSDDDLLDVALLQTLLRFQEITLSNGDSRKPVDLILKSPSCDLCLVRNWSANVAFSKELQRFLKRQRQQKIAVLKESLY